MGMIDTKLFDTKLNRRKKCIGEYNDLYHIFHPNWSEKYQKNIKENKKIYRNYKGVFTNMYDAANRNGKFQLFPNKYPKKDKEEKKHTNSALETTWASGSNRIRNAREFAKNLLKKNKETKDSFFETNNTFTSSKAI